MKLKPEKLKVIVFDLGGVILNLNVAKTFDGFKRLFGPDFNVFSEGHLNESFFVDYETGRISCDAFRQYFRELTKMEVSNAEIDLSWNAMLGDLPAERIKWLKELKKDFKICILSNTNLIHVTAFHEIFREQTSLIHPDRLFDRVYYSCDMGMRKPDANIYREVLRDLDVNAGETLFLDDKQENIATAKQLGMNVMLVERNNLNMSLLSNFIKSV